MINTHQLFTSALAQDNDLKALLAKTQDSEGHDLYNIFEYPCEEELGDNPGKPYIVVKNAGTVSEPLSKDDPFDPLHDLTTVEVSCVADDKSSIIDVAVAARKSIAEYLNNLSTTHFDIIDLAYRDNGIQFDIETMNYYTTMTYRIETY